MNKSFIFVMALLLGGCVDIVDSALGARQGVEFQPPSDIDRIVLRMGGVRNK